LHTALRSALLYENMYRELTNLVPTERSRAFRQEYFRRLATVALVMLTVLIGIHAVLLAPSYIYFKEQVAAKRTQLALLEGSLTSAEEQEVGARLKSLEDDRNHLNRLASYPAFSTLMRALLEVPRSGIVLTNFSFAPGQGDAEARVMLSGVAETRTALREYNLALSSLPFVSKVDLPISTYAKETELPFTITITGSLTP